MALEDSSHINLVFTKVWNGNIAPDSQEVKDVIRLSPTKVLLRELKSCRMWPYSENSDTLKQTRGLVYDLIKTELSTREHVPNKLEAKIARQLAAKRKR